MNPENKFSMDKLPNYGGQAVIEGVMMRGKHSVALAMRAPNNEIITHIESLGKIYRSKLSKIPFLRGLVILWDALVLGTRMLTLSANTQTGEDEQLEGPFLYLTLGISLLVGIALFSLLPAFIGQITERTLFDQISGSAWLGNLVEGLVRLGILIGYIWAIGNMQDIRRVFAYHGAEHMTINAFEDGADLTPKNVSRYSLQHPRCGTAFLLTVVLISVLLFSFLGPLPLLWRLLTRVLLLPVVAGLAYEYIRWTAKHLDSPLVKLMVKPNLALQLLTTRRPSEDMLEVSITAFNAMRMAENEFIS
ncbi:MAG: DUF1385 domain-containing protein [Anaerolineales bacterium]|jgi:uncharacterized protein YqhQ